MPIPIKIMPQFEAFDPYAEFNTPYGQKLLELFKAGASLCVWRCTTPWNFYLETEAGEQYCITGKDEGEPLRGNAQLRGLQKLAKHAGRSEACIRYAMSNWEVGKPEKEWWSYDQEAARAAEVLWAQTQERYQKRTVGQKPYAPDTKALPETALALWRTLRDGCMGSLPRFPELEDAFSQLDAQGVIEMRRDGTFALVPMAASTRLPRGKRFAFTTA